MAKLNAKTRNALPSAAFAEPSQRKYPIKKEVDGKLVGDRAHAANAKSRAAQNASPAERKKIDSAANKVLGEKKTPAKVDHVALAAKHDAMADRHRAMSSKHMADAKVDALNSGARPTVSEFGSITVPMKGVKK